MKKVLLDTNVIIHREAKKIVRGDIGALFWWLDNLRYQKCIHKITASEIRRHHDADVKATMAIKLESYTELQTSAPISTEINALLESESTANDRNDTMLLSEVCAGRVNILITEDANIHKKAKQLKAEQRVFTISGFLSKCRAENPDMPDYKILSARQTRFGKLDINDPFFESFMTDYGSEFKNWFAKKSEEKVFVCKSEQNSRIAAFLYLKIERSGEQDPGIQPRLPGENMLKIGSFKVTDTGHKLGERFLKIVFDLALQRKVDCIYVTMFDTTDEHQKLIRLLNAWGFRDHGVNTSRVAQKTNKAERVLVRDFRAHLADDAKTSYPYISKKWRKFIVPIYPEYHTELLPDSILRTENPAEFMASAGHRNALQKVYISWSRFKALHPKDIIVFYRTGGYRTSVVTTIGVVTDVVTQIPSIDAFIDLCKTRSVFSQEELTQMWNKYSWVRPFVVKFLYVYSLPKRINMQGLIDLGVLADIKSAPRGFEPLSDASFTSILENSRANQSFIVD